MNQENNNRYPYLWDSPEDYPEKCIAIYDRKSEGSPDRFLFKKTSPVSGEVNTFVFSLDITMAEILKYDSIENSAMLPLVNQKILKLLNVKVPKDFKSYKAQINCIDGVLNDYRILHILRSVRAVDHDRSIPVCTTNGKSIIGFDSLSHKPDVMKGFMLAREAERGSNVLVSPNLVGEFLINKITGTNFFVPNGDRV